MISTSNIPPLVARAHRTSLELGYINTTRVETGRLIMTLAATCRGQIGECGSGCGVGAAWLRSGARPDVTVITAEIDEELAARARETLGTAGVEVVHAKFATLADHGPFSLIYVDIHSAMAPEDYDIAYNALEPGGILVIDEMEGFQLAPEDPMDVARRIWLADPRFVGTEVYVTPDAPVLILVKR